jgi:hypothetical protein
VWCEECGTLHPAPEDDLGDMPQFSEYSSEEEKAEPQGAVRSALRPLNVV